MIGMKMLERVVIGDNCSTYDTPPYDENEWYDYEEWSHYVDRLSEDHSDCYFYLKDCERLRELKIGSLSFRHYSLCEIENVPSLEVIEIGEFGEWSSNFYYASLELKSDCEE